MDAQNPLFGVMRDVCSVLLAGANMVVVAGVTVSLDNSCSVLFFQIIFYSINAR